MLPMDMALLSDTVFKQYVELFAENENEFFAAFASAYAKVRFDLRPRLIYPASAFGQWSQSCRTKSDGCSTNCRNFLLREGHIDRLVQ